MSEATSAEPAAHEAEPAAAVAPTVASETATAMPVLAPVSPPVLPAVTPPVVEHAPAPVIPPLSLADERARDLAAHELSQCSVEEAGMSLSAVHPSVVLVSAFVMEERVAGRFRDTVGNYRARFSAFADRPVTR